MPPTTTKQPTDAHDVEHKDVGTLEIKDAEKGEVEAIVATCGVVDKDYDIILPDAIKDGSKVKMSSYGHGAMYGDTPVGKGTLTMDGNKAVFRGKIFLATAQGRETFEVLKEMGKDQEWSFGFRVMGSEVPSEEQRKQGVWRIITKLDAFEVSPVLRGAGVGTRTVATKDAPPAEPPAESTAEEVAAKAAAVAEKLAADEAEARAATEQKALDDAAADRAAAAFKARCASAAEEFQRIQRTHKRLGWV